MVSYTVGDMMIAVKQTSHRMNAGGSNVAIPSSK